MKKIAPKLVSIIAALSMITPVGGLVPTALAAPGITTYSDSACTTETTLFSVGQDVYIGGAGFTNSANPGAINWTIDGTNYSDANVGGPVVDGSFCINTNHEVDSDESGTYAVHADQQLGEDAANIANSTYEVPEPAPTSSISGMKWNDLDGDGIQDPGESGLSGWTIEINNDGDFTDSTVTDVDGNYSFSDLPFDTYYLCEAGQEGWEQTYPTSNSICQDDGAGHEVTLSSTEAATGIDFGNEAVVVSTDSALITIIKETVGGLGLFNFTLTGPEDYNQAFSLETTSDSTSVSVTYEVPASEIETSYTITEIIPAGWELDSIYCEYDGSEYGILVAPNSEEVTVDAGDEVTCTFVNTSTDTALITILKETPGNWGDFTFSVTGPEGEGQFSQEVSLGTTADDSTAQTSVEVPAGSESTTYTLIENESEGWDIDDLDCYYGGYSEGEEIINGEEVYLQAGDEVTCHFTNIANSGLLTVIKHVINDNGETASAEDFTIEVTSNGEVATISGSESGQTLGLGDGIFKVFEQESHNYETVYSGDCEGTIVLGQHKTCTITNNDVSSDDGSSSGSVANNDDNGNGGGSVLGASSDTETKTTTGAVLGASCPLPSYEELIMIRDGSGANPETVKAVQKWLNSHENAGLTVTGVYDQPTRFAVMLFQEKHSTDTLGSWGIEKATGNIWLTTANVMLIVAGCGGYDLSGVNLFPFSN